MPALSPAYIPSAYNRAWQMQVLDECLVNAEQTLRTKIFSAFTFRRHPVVFLTFSLIFFGNSNNNNKQPFSICFPSITFKIGQLIFQRHWPKHFGGRGDNLGLKTDCNWPLKSRISWVSTTLLMKTTVDACASFSTVFMFSCTVDPVARKKLTHIPNVPLPRLFGESHHARFQHLFRSHLLFLQDAGLVVVWV